MKRPGFIFEEEAGLAPESLDGFVPKGRNVFFIFHVFSNDEFHLDKD